MLYPNSSGKNELTSLFWKQIVLWSCLRNFYTIFIYVLEIIFKKANFI